MRERSVGAMAPLDKMEIMCYGVPKMGMLGNKEDEVEPPPPPPTFPLVPPHYAVVRSLGDMEAFQYQIHLETL